MDKMGFDCDHGGTYTDPISGVRREYDIRAFFHKAELHGHRCRGTLWLAAECKNIRKNFPLVVSTTERRESESFFDLLLYKGNALSDSDKFSVRRIQKSDIYRVGEEVGKSCNQVGKKRGQGNKWKITANDHNVFDRISQAVNSAFDLIDASSRDYNGEHVDFIVPILVVPDDSLWAVKYSETGVQSTPPRLLEECPIFLEQEWIIKKDSPFQSDIYYTLSHLDIVTISALSLYVERLLDSNNGVFRRNNLPRSWCV